MQMLTSDKRRRLFDAVVAVGKDRNKASTSASKTLLKDLEAEPTLEPPPLPPPEPELELEQLPKKKAKKTQTANKPTPEPKPEPQPHSKPEPQPDTKPEPLPDPKPEPMPPSAVVALAKSAMEVYVVEHEHSENRLQYGLSVRIRSEDKAAGVSVCKLDVGVPTPLRIKTELLEPLSSFKPTTKIATMERKSRIFKQICLENSDFTDPLTKPEVEAVNKVSPEELSWDHVLLGLSQLRESWPNRSIHCVWPQQLLDFLAGELSPDRAQCYERYLTTLLSRYELVLVVIWVAGHFTLLSLRNEPEPRARYFETLNDYKQKNKKNAERVCELMQVAFPETRSNVSRQTGASCGVQILHYAEVELRRLSNESTALAGWPTGVHIGNIRARLGQWVSSLGGELKKWAKEKAMELDKAKERAAKWRSYMEQLEAQGKLSEAAKQDAEAFAKLLFNANAAVVSELEPPDDWSLAFERLQQVRFEQRKLLLELRQLQDEPEPVKAAQPDTEPAEPATEPPQASEPATEPATEPASEPDWRLELLPPDRRKVVQQVMSRGVGVCSKCRYSHGCLRCSGEKALRYHLTKDGWVGPAVWNC